VTIEAGDVLDVKDGAFQNAIDLDVIKVGTKRSVTISPSAMDNSFSLNYIAFRRDLRSILSLPERFDHYLCSGGKCQCKPGSENVLPSADNSDYFACTACTPGKFSSMASLGVCDVCPMGKFMYEHGAIECDECVAGKYLDKEGMTLASECITCPAGSYSANMGNAVCTECPSGSYSTATKARTVDTCVACPIDTYTAAGGSSACSACPGGESTNGKEGASACITPESASLSLKNRDDVLKLFSSGMAYMLSILACIAFAAIGYFLMTIRVKNAILVPIPVGSICGRLAISALSIMSEAFMLAIMFSEGTTLFFRLGCIIVLGRCGNVIPTVIVLYTLFGSNSTWANKLGKCFDQNHFIEKVQPYAMLSFLSLWDCTLVALLPWRYSEFAEKAQGFPDMLTLRTTSSYKICQDIARFVCNVFYLLNAQNEASAASVEVMTYFNMAASVASIVLAGMTAVMKNSVLADIEATKGTAADTQSDDRIEEGDMELGSVEHYTDNPLHGDPNDPSVLLQRLPGTASVRSLIVQLLPDVSGPSLHAVVSAFKKDGVSTIEELKTYLSAGLIGINELKGYANDGSLSMSEIMALVTALKPFMSGEGGSGGGGSSDGSGGPSTGSKHDANGDVHDSGAVMSMLQNISNRLDGGLEDLHLAVSSAIITSDVLEEEEGENDEGGLGLYGQMTPTVRRQSAQYSTSALRMPSQLGSSGTGSISGGGPAPLPPSSDKENNRVIGRRGSYGQELRQMRMNMAPIPDLMRRASMTRRASMRTAVKIARDPSPDDQENCSSSLDATDSEMLPGASDDVNAREVDGSVDDFYDSIEDKILVVGDEDGQHDDTAGYADAAPTVEDDNTSPLDNAAAEEELNEKAIEDGREEEEVVDIATPPSIAAVFRRASTRRASTRGSIEALSIPHRIVEATTDSNYGDGDVDGGSLSVHEEVNQAEVDIATPPSIAAVFRRASTRRASTRGSIEALSIPHLQGHEEDPGTMAEKYPFVNPLHATEEAGSSSNSSSFVGYAAAAGVDDKREKKEKKERKEKKEKKERRRSSSGRDVGDMSYASYDYGDDVAL
jgi:hypothetical protein